jgi:hypothetical protein
MDTLSLQKRVRELRAEASLLRADDAELAAATDVLDERIAHLNAQKLKMSSSTTTTMKDKRKKKTPKLGETDLLVTLQVEQRALRAECKAFEARLRVLHAQYGGDAENRESPARQRAHVRLLALCNDVAALESKVAQHDEEGKAAIAGVKQRVSAAESESERLHAEVERLSQADVEVNERVRRDEHAERLLQRKIQVLRERYDML